ncbi:hypothetical protein [Streptomyces sp. 2A115]|uniref:hypothetical protein n=1 Tax=Streptomyces sp. 2A115 TaxID=3457439 RepID=UPI003FD2B170
MGPAGASGLAAEAACLVIVDVLSFTTAVSVAVETGIRVLPFWLPDGPATTAEQAQQRGPPPSTHSSPVRGRPSPAAPSRPTAPGPSPRPTCAARLVPPSPNGAAIAAAAGT